jgi:molybdopterin converting factor small subunit
MVPSMRVRIRPYADFGRFFPGTGKIREIEIPAGASIDDVLMIHGLAAEERLTIGLNGELAQRDAKLAAGDLIDILAPMSGGM